MPNTKSIFTTYRIIYYTGYFFIIVIIIIGGGLNFSWAFTARLKHHINSSEKLKNISGIRERLHWLEYPLKVIKIRKNGNKDTLEHHNSSSEITILDFYYSQQNNGRTRKKNNRIDSLFICFSCCFFSLKYRT